MEDNKLTISKGDLWDFLQKTLSEKTFLLRTSRADKLESVAESLIQFYHISDNLTFVKKILRDIDHVKQKDNTWREGTKCFHVYSENVSNNNNSAKRKMEGSTPGRKKRL